MSAFDKVIGYEAIKEKLRSYADCLANPTKYAKMGVHIPSGILFYGEPGLGKTLMAKCLMEESGLNSYIIRKSYPNGHFVDDLREKVINAAMDGPSIVLFDDMDKYANEDDRHQNADAYVTIQSLIDDYDSSEVFFIATVNDISALPNSLKRAGRFDCQINVSYPLPSDSEKILGYYLDKQKLSKDIDREIITRLACGFSCASMENIINEAGIYAAFHEKDCVDQESLLYACIKEMYGDDSLQTDEFSKKDWKSMKKAAVHEVGHALISEVLKPGSINMVSILKGDRRSVKGFTDHKLIEGMWMEEDYEKYILSSLGGKAASEIVLGDVDFGCEDDITEAARKIERMIESNNKYGFQTGWGLYDCEWSKPNRDQMISFELERYYLLSKRIISRNREFFEALLKELEEKKIITFRDIERIRNKVEIKTA